MDQAAEGANALHSCGPRSERFRGGQWDLKEAIYSRRSVREFTAETVSEKILRDLIEAAVQAPSAVNAQPCTFCVIRDKTVLATISQEAEAHMVKTTPVGLMSHHFKEILNDPNFNIFYNAPVLILISTIGDIPWAVEDCALAAENLMLAARGAGVGTCLDRLCPIVARNARGQSAPQTSGELQAGRTDHRWPSESGAVTDTAEGARNPLGRSINRQQSVHSGPTR